MPTPVFFVQPWKAKTKCKKYYRRLAERCGFSQQINEPSVEWAARRLDRMCFCASQYPARTQADEMTRRFCGDWKLTETTGVVNLNWRFVQHAKLCVTADTPEQQMEQLKSGWKYLQKLQLGELTLSDNHGCNI